MTAKIVIGILIPFIGTSLGAAMVFFLAARLQIHFKSKSFHKLEVMSEK